MTDSAKNEKSKMVAEAIDGCELQLSSDKNWVRFIRPLS